MSKLKYALIVLFFGLILAFASWPTAGKPAQGPTGYDGIHAQCFDCATATPVLLVDQASGTGGGVVSEWRIAATPILRALRTGGFIFTAPTSVATSQPAVVIDSRAAGSNLLELRKNGTPVASIANNGALSGFGSSGLSVAPNLVVAAPTGVGTATPAALINNAGVSNLLEVQDGGVVRIQAFNGGGVKIAAPTDVPTAVPVLNIDTAGVSSALEIRKNATPVAALYGDGTNLFGTGSVSAGEIADATRRVNIPLNAFIECQTDAGALIGFDTTADALPDFVNSATDGTGLVIRFDDTGSSEDQGTEICSQLSVPADYVSGGAFVIRALKDAHTAATEVLNCAVSVNGAALEAAGTTTTTASASTSYTCTPTIAALAANDSLSFYLSITSDSTMNDLVDIASVAFSYTASQ